MAFPEDLLEQARHLARREKRRPKQASLRRAVSTAYYALFHLLISETSKNWRRAEERDTLARMFDHGVMKKACTVKRDDLNRLFKTKPAAARTQLDQRLYRLAETFIDMQQNRHSADYDNSRKWTRTDTLDKVESVAEAFRILKEIRNEASA